MMLSVHDWCFLFNKSVHLLFVAVDDNIDAPGVNVDRNSERGKYVNS